jgi:SAM-dependent methyltransferase
MIESKHYTKSFFEMHYEGPYLSAKEIVPLVYDTLKPVSVVDFGCGVGNWLKVWNEMTPVKKLLGIEGPYIKKELLKIPADQVLFADLKDKIDLKERFDLVVSLEVAEHIQADHADIFVSNLVNAGDVILFSAAIVKQIGTFHVNEQYPEYWAAKFKKFGYVPVDYFRPLIWNNNKIEYWYRQNVLLFIKLEKLADFPELIPCQRATHPDCLLRIHPEHYEIKLELIRRTESFFGLLHWKLYKLKVRLKELLGINQGV